jgi:hypothetical protein
VPLAELVILGGIVSLAIGVIGGHPTAIGIGVALAGLGGMEVAVREHFAGYRSHTTLLAAAPAAALVVLVGVAFGEPGTRSGRELLLLAAVPVFALCFWLLRKRFLAARQARVARPRGR